MLREIDMKKCAANKRNELLSNVKDSIQYGLQHIEHEKRLYSCTAWLIKCEVPSPLYGDLQPAYILKSYETYIALIVHGDMFDVLLPMYGERTATSGQHLSKTIKYLTSQNVPVNYRYRF